MNELSLVCGRVTIAALLVTGFNSCKSSQLNGNTQFADGSSRTGGAKGSLAGAPDDLPAKNIQDPSPSPAATPTPVAANSPTPSVDAVILDPTPTPAPTPTPVPTPQPLFYIGVEDRSNDPDSYPYGDFFLCLHGNFKHDGNKVVSTSAQKARFDLNKYSGCGRYDVTITAKAPDGTTQVITRTMTSNSGESWTTNLNIVAGTELAASLYIAERGGGCDVHQTRVMIPTGNALTSFVPNGQPAACHN